MKKSLLVSLFAAIGIVCASSVFAQLPAKMLPLAAEVVVLSATVDSVDVKKRIVVLKDSNGNLAQMNVAKSVNDLDKVKKGDGYNLKNLNNIRIRFQKLGCEVELYCLNDKLDKNIDVDVESAYVLVIRNAIQKVWNTYDELIEEQKIIVEHQKTLVEEKQKEVLDSIHYARRIQRALVTSEFYVSKQLKKLNNK